jgi:hypothetical protein
MDWYLRGEDSRLLSVLRHQVTAYLRRHGEEGCDVADATLVMEEIVGNALRHASGPVWISLSWRERSPHLTVRDLGPGFDPSRLEAIAQLTLDDPVALNDPATTGPNGTSSPEPANPAVRTTSVAALRERRNGGGMEVRAVLPVTKPPAVSHDPPRHTLGSFPILSEPEPRGGFARELFLRALVVQLAHTLELHHGPDAAEAAVAQVGIDVGGRMEEEYRLATAVVGRLTPDQMADCFVRLKNAMDGAFHVVEANEERIVLGNRRCPFGGVVRQAPSLCRMTSSVFGGIAARNRDDGAAVLAEERLAVGDPECKVIIYLGEPPEAARPYAHRYASPPTITQPALRT